jgi:hypothetical protein
MLKPFDVDIGHASGFISKNMLYEYILFIVRELAIFEHGLDEPPLLLLWSAIIN